MKSDWLKMLASHNDARPDGRVRFKLLLNSFINSLSTNSRWETIAGADLEIETDLAEDPAETSEEAAADSTEIEDIPECMMLSAINAGKRAKSRSGQQKASLFFAVIVSGKAAAVQEADHLNQEYLQNNLISLMQNLTK